MPLSSRLQAAEGEVTDFLNLSPNCQKFSWTSMTLRLRHGTKAAKRCLDSHLDVYVLEGLPTYVEGYFNLCRYSETSSPTKYTDAYLIMCSSIDHSTMWGTEPFLD